MPGPACATVQNGKIGPGGEIGFASMTGDSADLRRLTQLRSLVLGSMAQSAQIRAFNGFRPAPGSQLERESILVERELAGAWGESGENPIRGTFLTALTLAAAVDQHLQALDNLAQTRIVFSGAVVLRALIEAAARAWWLLAPDVDARGRVARGITERVYSMGELRRMYAQIEGEPVSEEHDRLKRRIDATFAAAQAKGLTIVADNRTGRPVAVGEPRPRSLPLIDDFFAAGGIPDGAMIYRRLSAKTHATLYGLAENLRLADTQTIPGIDVGDDHTRLGMLEESAQDREMTLIVALMAHGDLTQRLVEITGWPDELWKSWWLHTAKRTREILRAPRPGDRP
jgi:hypothetical protein